MPDDITEKVLDLIAATKRLPREQVTVSSSFEELGLDSLDAINLIYEVESEFDVSVSNEVCGRHQFLRQREDVDFLIVLDAGESL